MIRACSLMLAGSLLLAQPSSVAARCYGSGPTFRCDPIISESLRRKSLVLPNRYAPKPEYRYEFKSRHYPSPVGGGTYRYDYKDNFGRYKGTIRTTPYGTTHRGRWRQAGPRQR